jgi:membrane protein implicated in regulation of membrane protease activity
MFLTIQIGTIMAIIWISVMVLALIIEGGTMDLSSVWFSAGALAALVVALIWPEAYIPQIVVFILVSIALLILIRPIIKDKMKKNEIKTNADSLVGKVAVCTKDILNGERGEVKIEGKIWTAISNEDVVIGDKVTVLAIKGVKLVVRKN